ncbi:hypothetical protein PCANC_25981 [Puccinia coronata f. sp. avenae]|uniref:Autophagy-related protein 2 n=1 Tax=Puccinia coronata f. sp. avenae TaxID=200324 RepID=A0A2N5TEE3_9BASI|nr:hypothetical protein PCASD_14709 [Puccinia coronata f. sp. avenae]PLW27946.1 hypothetical protein PCANC_25981 [Puccinia coronata f. sp. avenae]
MVPFSLPSFVPSNLQHKLLSYLVRRFLGPLLKNGAQSLDAQLATPSQPGTFTLKDVQLNPSSLADHLSGSLSFFSIQAVSVSELSLQINWPSWSFSLQGYVPDVKVKIEGIQVILGLSERESHHHSTQHELPPSHLLQNINLDESLATIANDFVSQEWADSSAHDDQIEQDFPGAFITKAYPELPSPTGDQDQRGFFSGLVQKMLAKFNFQLTHLTLLFQHQELQLLLSVDHIKSLELPLDDVHPSCSISREIRTSCPVIYLYHPSDQAQAPSPCNSSSTGSYDSEHDMLLSQAIVDLRRSAALSAPAAEIHDPTHKQLSDSPTLPQSIMKPENILVQFIGSPPNDAAQVPEPSFKSVLPHEEEPSAPEDSKDFLDPNNSLRFLFWAISNTSSGSTEKVPLDANTSESTSPPDQDTTPHSGVQQFPQLNVEIYLPMVDVSIRFPRNMNALTRLVSALNLATSSTTTNPQSNLPTFASQKPSLAISATLRLHALNCTLTFPSPNPDPTTTHCNDIPLSSLNVKAQVIYLVFNTSQSHPLDENQAGKPRYELTLRVDQIKGRSELRHTHSSTLLNSVFLLAPARDDHPGPAVYISQTVNATHMVFSSIWLNLDLKIVAVLMPLVEGLQSTPVIDRAGPGSSAAKMGGDHAAPTPGPSSSNLNAKQENFKTTISIPCLYMDMKSPSQRELSHHGRSHPDLILGSVLKTFQLIITSERQIGCSVFEVALGFRVGQTDEEHTHAPLSPFLGIAHPSIPSSTDQQNRFAGLRITHSFLSPRSQNLARTPVDSYRRTSIKLETVTIDLSKDQFDRLQYWIDDLGRWANSLFIDSPAGPSDQHTTLDDTNNQPAAFRPSLKNRPEEMKVEDGKDGLSRLLATLTVSKIALTIRLPPENLQPPRQAAPLKLVINMELLSIDQLRQPLHDEFDDQIRLLIRSCSASLYPQHQQPSVQSLPILYQAHPPLPKGHTKTEALPAVSVEVSTVAQSQLTSHQPQRKKILLNVYVNHTTLRLGPCCIWTSELARFLKAPAGAFEAVGPEYESRINFELVGCAIQLVSPPSSSTATASSSAYDEHSGKDHDTYSGSSFILQLMADRARFKLALDSSSTVVSPSLNASVAVWLAECPPSILSVASSSPTVSEQTGFAPIVSLNDLELSLVYSWAPGRPTCRTTLNRGSLTLSFCADSADCLAESISRLSEISFQAKRDVSPESAEVPPATQQGQDPIIASAMLRSAMRELPSSSRSILIQKDVDLVEEDYPTDITFLDQNPSASSRQHHQDAPAILRYLSGQGLSIIDDYLLRPPASSKVLRQAIETEIQVEHLDVLVKLHDGYDWNSTRQTIEQARKTMRKRLQKIRQLLATGNPADDARSMEEDLGPTTLFKSLHIGGLDSSTRGLSTAQLLDAIDDQLGKEAIEPVSDETESMAGSWQSLNPHPSKDQPYPRVVSAPSAKQHHLSRSPLPMLKIVLNRVQGHFRKYYHDRQSEEANTHESTDCRLSSLQLKTDSLTIIDNIPTSTWKKFLTELRPGEGGMLRPTGAPMARFKLVVTPSARDSALKEAVVKLKISPLRLYVDQDAVDFLKTFLSFQKHAPPAPSSVSISAIPDPSTAPPADGLFFQRVEILPIRIKLDYKPKRVNYMALKEGKTIELMNFFHFEGSDMVLRHATLTGISRASKIGELLQEIWTPDVKANQLADVISGIAPVRSVVNLGTGIADLVLLPIEEMKKKDGRLSRGIQKGTSSFAKNTTLEVIKLGARLATGTQVVLEKAESILGAKFHHELCGETIDHMSSASPNLSSENPLPHQHELFSKYALQPESFKAGAQSAYHDLRDNFRSTAQTILAVPLEVFNEGSGQAVVKAIPIAILHPMVGATGAISKTLLGLHNSLDPHGSASHLLDKYKQHPSSSDSDPSPPPP